MHVLVTGGCGYIASHTAVELMAAGHHPVLLDNLSNSKSAVVDRIEQITGKRPGFVRADIRDEKHLDRLFGASTFDAVLHFAGLKAVGESVAKPLEYYDNNVYGSIVLLRAMARAGVDRIVFSSSATVYGEPDTVPITEDFPIRATNPYGRSKLMVEEILGDYICAEPTAAAISLRYFNPVGAHPSGLIGEDPNGIPNNLVPYIGQVAVGRRDHLSVFGDDYPTPDGTGVRDYVHVVDLADAHVAALEYITDRPGEHTVNVGTGKGTSVLEMLGAYSAACGRDLPYEIAPRRPGDVAQCYADTSRAQRELGWSAQLGIEEMAADSWRWQSGNPNGYPDSATDLVGTP